MSFLSLRVSIASWALALGLMLAVATAGNRDWTVDYDAALNQAKIDKKTVLLNFTGSDWCGWCIALDKEVFSKPEFKQYAEKNLILVKLDFPERKPQSKAERKRNDSLAEKYKVEGFPTIVVLGSEGKILGQMGYVDGGPKNFIAELEKIKK